MIRKLYWLLLPALVLLGWFIIEQLPVWTAPQPAWVRYPDVVALPGGCAAANALQTYGAQRAISDQSALTQAEATERIAALMAAQYPDAAYNVVLPAELVGGMFGAETLAWWSVVGFSDTPLLPAGASVFVSAQTGEPIAVITTIGGGAPGMDGVCGNFTPQPRGLRAQLRPYLPLIGLAGYVGVVVVGTAVLKVSRRMRREGH